MNMKNHKFLSAYIVILFLFYSSFTKAQTQSLWVGQSYTCDATSSMMGLTSDKSWTTSGGYISLSGSGHYRNVTVTQFFSGTASVTFSWKERLYSNDTPRSRSKTWYFKCIENPVSIMPTTMSICVGEKGQLSYYHMYDNNYTSAANITYSSNNPSVAKVDKTGKVTAISCGTAYINVYSKLSDASKAPYCIVNVKEREYPSSIILQESLKLTEGDEYILNFKVNPSNAITEGLIWESENESIATISPSGKITAISVGQTIIKISAPNNISAKTTIRVLPKCSDIKLPTETKLLRGYSKKLEPSILPLETQVKLSWESSDNSIVSVTQDGTITGEAEGNANVVVKTNNGLSSTIKVSVVLPPSYLQPNRIRVRAEVVKQMQNL